MRSAILAATCALVFGVALFAQASDEQCDRLSYEDHNQIGYGALHANHVSGIVQDASGVAIPMACVGIFTESDHKLVAAARTNDNGLFELDNVRRGNYRLVVKYDGLCAANARLRIVRRWRDSRHLVVVMRPGGIDTCSYVELR